jgi:hypothetical protein
MNTQEQLKKGKEVVCFRVQNSTERGYGHITIGLVYYDPEASSQHQGMSFYDNYYNDKHKYRGITIKSQSGSGGLSSDNAEPYGYEIQLDTHHKITTSVAKEFLDAMRPIQRKLDKIIDIEGHPQSYLEYVVRLVRVFGVKRFYHKNYDRPNDLTEYLSDVSYFRSYMEQLVDHNHKTINPNKDAA